MSLWDDAVYQFQLTAYDLKLRGTPPVVMPINPSPELQAEVDAIPSIPEMLGAATKESVQSVASFAFPYVLVLTLLGIGVLLIYSTTREKLKI